MTTIIFATNNENKVVEMKSLIGENFNVLSLRDAGIDIDIPEPHDTLESNAKEKSSTIYRLTKKSCFGEDTGLEVECLGGKPGVLSARYAGPGRSSEDNINKLLFDMKDAGNRRARFRTVISLFYNDNNFLFEGICNGFITTESRGILGFGYDSIFIPEGSDKTFGEMSLEEKNIWSHRKKAANQLVSFLSQYGKVAFH